MTKKVTFAKPKPKAAATASADQWVESRGGSQDRTPTEPMKRFTIDVPASLHARVKAGCAMRGVKMAEVIRAYLEDEFPEG